jgi:hypothetical protein
MRPSCMHTSASIPTTGLAARPGPPQGQGDYHGAFRGLPSQPADPTAEAERPEDLVADPCSGERILGTAAARMGRAHRTMATTIGPSRLGEQVARQPLVNPSRTPAPA